MNNDTVVSLAAPARVSDPLTELLRTGARRLIEAAVSAEFEEYLSGFVQEQLPDGRQRVVRNGHLPERKILTGVGEVDVRVPKARTRSGQRRNRAHRGPLSHRPWAPPAVGLYADGFLGGAFLLRLLQGALHVEGDGAAGRLRSHACSAPTLLADSSSLADTYALIAEWNRAATGNCSERPQPASRMDVNASTELCLEFRVSIAHPLRNRAEDRNRRDGRHR